MATSLLLLASLAPWLTQGVEYRYWPVTPTFKWDEYADKHLSNYDRGRAAYTRDVYAVIERVFHQNGMWQTSLNSTPALMFGYQGLIAQTLPKLASETRYSMCPGLGSIGDKSMLRKNLDFFESTVGRGPHAAFFSKYYNVPEQISELTREQEGWVVVRDVGSHNSEHLHIRRAGDVSGIMSVVNQTSDAVSNRRLKWIATEYIKPLLWDGRKWDFRVYVLVTGVDPMRVWLGERRLAFARIAPKLFSFDDLSKDVHTTASITGANHIRVFDDARHLFSDQEWDSIWRQVERAALVALVAVEPRVRSNGKRLLLHSEQCSELLAFDFILSERGQVFLLEGNRNFRLDYADPVLGAIKATLLNDYLCVLGLSCSRASKAPIATIPGQERQPLEPFEHAPNPTDRLADDHRRILARANRTEFRLIWPPQPDMEDLAWDLQKTDEWFPSHFTKSLWSKNASSPPYQPSVVGATDLMTLESL